MATSGSKYLVVQVCNPSAQEAEAGASLAKNNWDYMMRPLIKEINENDKDKHF